MPGRETFERITRMLNRLYERTRAGETKWDARRIPGAPMADVYSYSTSTPRSTIIITESTLSSPRLSIIDTNGSVVEEYEKALTGSPGTLELDKSLDRLANAIRQQRTEVDQFLDQVIDDLG